jgi:hypothetical protein
MELSTSDDGAESDAAIGTRSGQEVRPFDPRPQDVTLPDIAHATANVCRASGQSDVFYSVGLHSLYVSEDLERRGESPHTQLYGLLHDASEAYVADVPGPLKRHLPNYRRAEERVQSAVWSAFDLPDPPEAAWSAVKSADDRLQRYELPELMPSQDWEGKRPDLPYDLHADGRLDVPARFEQRAEQLAGAAAATVPRP